MVIDLGFLVLGIAGLGFLCFLWRVLKELDEVLKTVAVIKSASSPQQSVGNGVISTRQGRKSRQYVKEPPLFAGDASTFKEWVFSLELALKAESLAEPEKEVDFAASFLTGNARLSLIAVLESGESFTNWQELKTSLARMYSPKFDQEQARVSLFTLKQRGSLQEYIAEFTRLSLQVPELDEHSRAVLFTNGLHSKFKQEVLREHPTCLSGAVQAALLVAQASFSETSTTTGRRQMRRNIPVERRRWPSKLTPEEREKLSGERRCFACWKLGHMARECTEQRYPNALRQ